MIHASFHVLSREQSEHPFCFPQAQWSKSIWRMRSKKMILRLVVHACPCLESKCKTLAASWAESSVLLALLQKPSRANVSANVSEATVHSLAFNHCIKYAICWFLMVIRLFGDLKLRACYSSKLRACYMQVGESSSLICILFCCC